MESVQDGMFGVWDVADTGTRTMMDNFVPGTAKEMAQQKSPERTVSTTDDDRRGVGLSTSRKDCYRGG